MMDVTRFEGNLCLLDKRSLPQP